MNSVRQFFLQNLPLKILSVILAFLLWLQVATQQSIQRTISAPVDLVNMPETLQVANDYPNRVNVVIRSDRGGNVLDERQMTVVVDLKSAEPGTRIVNFTEEDIDHPSGVEIVEFTPARIRLQLERTHKKLVQVEARTVGEPAPGYQVSTIRVVPSVVLVSGPESRIRDVSTAWTEPIHIEGLSGTVNQTAYLDLDDARLRIENPVSVEVFVVIEEKRRPYSLKGVMVKSSSPSQVQLLDTRINIEGSVPFSFKGELSAGEFAANVEVDGLEARREPYELIPDIIVPQEYEDIFRIEGTDPPQIKVRKIR